MKTEAQIRKMIRDKTSSQKYYQKARVQALKEGLKHCAGGCENTLHWLAGYLEALEAVLEE